MWVLDKADRMLDMGFIPAMRRIHAELPKQRQTLMFPATFSREIESLASEFLHQPKKIQVMPANTTVSRIDQMVHPVDKGRKTELLKHLVSSEQWGQVLVFSAPNTVPTSCRAICRKRALPVIRFMAIKTGRPHPLAKAI